MQIQRRVFAAFLALLFAVLIPAAILLDRWVSADVHNSIRESLTHEARVLALELERAPPDDLPRWVDRLASAAVARLTVVAADGRVLADSDVPEAGLPQVENHAARPEIALALGGATGAAVRRSNTVSRDMMYVAVPVGSPPRLVLRLALPLDHVSQTVGRANAAIWLAGLIAFALALVLGGLLSRWLTRPILVMTRAARAMTHGDFGVVLPEPREDELGDLLHALETLRAEVARRIDDLRSEGVKLRTILNGMTDGVALVQDGTITVANPAFAELLGAARAVEGRTLLEAARLPELADAIARAVSEQKSGERELQVAGKSLLLQAHPLGARREAVVLLIDTTETRRLERLRRDFVANASHELRTPVAAIVGVAETLSGGAADDPEARASFIDILLRHANRLSRLTSDLLDIARLEAGYRPRVESVALPGLVQAVATTLGPRAAEKKITLSMSLPEGLAVAGERPAVEQILTNLVENAIKYTPEGGQVRVSAKGVDGTVQLVVEDTGPGIPEEHLPRLFERFYRVDNARSRDAGGTGLGLAIVKHLAMANGGDVKVESRVGRGTTFVVSLPGG